MSFDGAGIVVLAYGRGGEYRPLVESLLAEGVAPASIVVVHNPAAPGEPALALPSPGIELVRPERNLGYAGGMNAGIARQREHGRDPIVLLTHDVRLRPGALARLLDASARLPGYGVLAPALAWPDGDEPFSFGGRTRRNGALGHIGERPELNSDGVIGCDWVDGGAMVLRREALDQVEGFDERFFAYCEESELCLRITRAGWRVGVVADALAQQSPGGSKRPGAWAYLLTRNGFEYARRAAGARGVAAKVWWAVSQGGLLGIRVLARGAGLRPGPAREPWVELVGMARGTADFARRRWGPPPASLPGLGDMSVPAGRAGRAGRGPRVLHLGPDPRTDGGMPAVLRGLVASPLAERYRLEVVPTYARRDPLRRFARFCVALVRLSAWSLAGRGRIVHVHAAARGSMYRKSVCVLLAKALRRRVVLHVHAGAGDLEDFDAGLGRPSRLLLRRAFARADTVLSVSAAGAAELSRAFGREDIAVVPNAAPTVEPPPPAGVAEREGLALLYLGGFADPAKGADVLLEALPSILSECPELHVLLAGPGEPSEQALALLRANRQVSWLSWLEGPRKAAAFGGADMVVFPSRSEGLPVSLLEALAYGRAIVATAVGGMPEVLTDRRDALLVAPGDPPALAGAVCELARDGELRARLGEAARERAERLNAHEVSDRLDDLYTGLLRR